MKFRIRFWKNMQTGGGGGGGGAGEALPKCQGYERLAWSRLDEPLAVGVL